MLLTSSSLGDRCLGMTQTPVPLAKVDEVRYFKKIKDIKEKLKKVEEARHVGKAGTIQVLVYGNGLFDYSLVTEDGEEELWNSKEGYDILVLGENCELAL